MDFLDKYKPFVWYPVTDDVYWIEDGEHEIIVTCPYTNEIYTQSNCYIGWGTMSKTEGYKFMIIKK